MTRLDAAKAGLTFYSASPCPKCGHEKRYVASGQCPPCNIARVKKQREKIRGIIFVARTSKNQDAQHG